MTKSEIRLTDPSLWSLLALLINQYYNCPIDEVTLFFVVMIYVSLGTCHNRVLHSCEVKCIYYDITDLIRFLIRTYKQIGSALDIGILTVKIKSK